MSFLSRLLKVSLSVGLIITLSSCQTTEMNEEQYVPERVEVVQPAVQKKFNVALLLPLSGSKSAVGQSMLKAAEMSIFDVSDNALKLIPIDTKGSSSGAADAVNEAVERKADLILGPVFAANARRIKSLARSKNIPVVTYTTDVSLASPGFFVFGFDVIEQIRHVMKYAAARDIRSVVAIIPQNAYGSLIESELKQLDTLRSINVLKVFKYGARDRDFSAIAAEIEGLNPAGIFIPEGGAQLNMILSSLQYNDFELEKYQLLGSGQWDHPKVVSNSAARGGWFANPSLNNHINFEKAYQNNYGEAPHRLASLAYDSVSMASILAKSSNLNPYSLVAMTQSRGFTGADGLFRLLSNGDTERSLAIFEVKRRAVQEIQPASNSF